jgi:hypothetical protein
MESNSNSSTIHSSQRSRIQLNFRGSQHLFAQRIAFSAFIFIIALLRDRLTLARESDHKSLSDAAWQKINTSLQRHNIRCAKPIIYENRFSPFLFTQFSGYANWFGSRECWLVSLCAMLYHQPSTRVLINETAVNLNVANDSCELVDESGQMRMQNEVQESLNEFNWSRERSSISWWFIGCGYP